MFSICFAKIPQGTISKKDVYDFFDSFSTELLVSEEAHKHLNMIHFHIYLNATKEVFKFI